MLEASIYRITAIIILATLVACANPAIVEISPDTYLLSRTDKGGVFGNPSKMKANVIREANEFAKSRGKVAIPVSVSETTMKIGRFAQIDYQFRLVDKDDPAAKATSLVGRADVVIQEGTQKTSVDVHTTDETEIPKDVYAELLKLEDLRQRGILTQAEFDAEKKKLLEGN